MLRPIRHTIAPSILQVTLQIFPEIFFETGPLANLVISPVFRNMFIVPFQSVRVSNFPLYHFPHGAISCDEDG